MRSVGLFDYLEQGLFLYCFLSPHVVIFAHIERKYWIREVLLKLVVKSTMFPHRNIHKYNWTSPVGKPHNQIGHIVIDRRRHSSILDVRSFMGADCDTEHYLVVAKLREKLAVSKQAAQ